VERQGGHAQAARALAPGPLTTDSALSDAFLAQYVTLRERFQAGQIERDYRTLAVWSDPAARARYGAEITRSNPASPLVRYPATTTVTTSITSVSRLSPSQALVRFTTSTQDAAAPVAQQQGWLASITYRLETAPLTNVQRVGNPLGFRVVEYRRDPDGSLPLTTPLLP
jgi:type IV secretion system protein VirB8